MGGEREAGTPRRRKLKVYAANYDGRREVLAACYSLVEFVRMSQAGRAYCHETWNTEDRAAALAQPGVVLIRAIDARSKVPWQVFKPAPQPTGSGATEGE